MERRGAVDLGVGCDRRLCSLHWHPHQYVAPASLPFLALTVTIPQLWRRQRRSSSSWRLSRSALFSGRSSRRLAQGRCEGERRPMPCHQCSRFATSRARSIAALDQVWYRGEKRLGLPSLLTPSSPLACAFCCSYSILPSVERPLGSSVQARSHSALDFDRLEQAEEVADLSRAESQMRYKINCSSIGGVINRELCGLVYWDHLERARRRAPNLMRR